jgi:hypothetical protein
MKGRFILSRDYFKTIFTCKWTALKMRKPPCMCARHTVRLAAWIHNHQGVLSTHSAQAQLQQQVQREGAMIPLEPVVSYPPQYIHFKWILKWIPISTSRLCYRCPNFLPVSITPKDCTSSQEGCLLGTKTLTHERYSSTELLQKPGK